MQSQFGNQLGNDIGTALHAKPTGDLVMYFVPGDALAARDLQLRGLLSKTGMLAAKQTWAMTITITATPEEAEWMREQILSGITPQRVSAITFVIHTIQPREPGTAVELAYSIA
jgi:hypothetical protein